MASAYWVKLYLEILHDPKMGRLSDRLWRRVIELYLLAGENGGTGDIPDTDDLAWTLRADRDELETELQELANIDVVRETETGWFVIEFAKHQSRREGSARGKRSRDWRAAVLTRDDYTCQHCGANLVPIVAHHIKPWFIAPLARYDINNGVTLCLECHYDQHRPGWKQAAIERFRNA